MGEASNPGPAMKRLGQVTNVSHRKISWRLPPHKSTLMTSGPHPEHLECLPVWWFALFLRETFVGSVAGSQSSQGMSQSHRGPGCCD